VIVALQETHAERTARFYTDGIALDVRHGVLRVLGGHNFGDGSLPAGILLLLH